MIDRAIAAAVIPGGTDDGELAAKAPGGAYALRSGSSTERADELAAALCIEAGKPAIRAGRSQPPR
jgi:hypothetical protein